MRTIADILTEKLLRIKGASEAAAVPENFLTVEATITALPVTIRDSAITPKHRVVEYSIFDEEAHKEAWTWETGSGTLTISGTLSKTTGIKMVLAKPTAIIGG